MFVDSHALSVGSGLSVEPGLSVDRRSAESLALALAEPPGHLL